LVKSYGERLRKRGTQQVSREMAAGLSAELREALEPLLREVESLNERIKEYDRRIEQIAKKDYPKVALLQQVKAVGELILDLYPGYRRSASIPEEPRRRMFSWAAAWAEELWAKRATDAHQQGRGSLSAMREKRQETSGGCGSEKVGGTASSIGSPERSTSHCATARKQCARWNKEFVTDRRVRPPSFSHHPDHSRGR
jgi:hypothetical protein